MSETWSIWMQIPATDGWSRIAAHLTQEDAERLAEKMLFPARAMPDNEEK